MSIHNDFYGSLCSHGVVAERNIDVVAKVGQFPDSAVYNTSHATRSLSGKLIALLRVKNAGINEWLDV